MIETECFKDLNVFGPRGTRTPDLDRSILIHRSPIEYGRLLFCHLLYLNNSHLLQNSFNFCGMIYSSTNSS
uniref:Uncharacterized protein n=1 Tax=Sinocyclocheilus rhinocerous TaxID=307959 RepID=A0A673MKD8_9TELE